MYGSLDSVPSVVECEGPGPAAEHLEAFEEAPDVDVLDEVAVVPVEDEDEVAVKIVEVEAQPEEVGVAGS